MKASFFTYIIISIRCSFLTEGIEVLCPEGNFVSKVILLVCTADLPAKAKVANSTQYNGYCGCNTCTIKGNYTAHVMTWDYDPQSTIRTHASIISHAKQAVQQGCSVRKSQKVFNVIN